MRRGRICCSNHNLSVRDAGHRESRDLPHAHARPDLVGFYNVRSPRTTRWIKVLPPPLEPEHRFHHALNAIDLCGERNLLNQRWWILLDRPPALAEPCQTAILAGLVRGRPLRLDGSRIGPWWAGKCCCGHWVLCLPEILSPRGDIVAIGLGLFSCDQLTSMRR